MVEHDKASEIANYLTTMSVAFDREIPEMLAEILMTELRKLPIENVRRGLDKLIRTHKYGFPKPADIFEACGATPQVACKDAVALQADAQWLKLLEAIKAGAFYRHSPAKPREFIDRTSMLVVRAQGGGAALDSWTHKDLPYRRREFVDLYSKFHGQEAAVLAGGHGHPELAGPDAGEIKKLTGGIKRIGSNGHAEAQGREKVA